MLKYQQEIYETEQTANYLLNIPNMIWKKNFVKINLVFWQFH